ncbi:MAG: hypothetical protein AAGA55_07385 [Planctomycetota bacterium]
MDPRGNLDLVPHTTIHWKNLDPEDLPTISNLVLKSKSTAGMWIEESSVLVGDYRSKLMSMYIQWSLAINGLHVAHDRYSDSEWNSTKQFTVSAVRPTETGLPPTVQTIAKWPGIRAAQAHLETTTKLIAWGIVELYALLEEFVFALYRVWWNNNPEGLLSGKEQKHLRALRVQAESNEVLKQSWKDAWENRLHSWQRNRLYSGLDKVILSYFQHTGLEKPSSYQESSPKTWAETIMLIALLRNALVHGAKTVSPELAAASDVRHNAGLEFRESSNLELRLFHLQAVEYFFQQLLTAINLSLSEHTDTGQ